MPYFSHALVSKHRVKTLATLVFFRSSTVVAAPGLEAIEAEARNRIMESTLWLMDNLWIIYG
jgi:hypothetical protein